MPVNKPKLQPSVKGFTKQDFLDGKCTKDGLPLGAQSEPEQPAAPEVESSPAADEAQPTASIPEETTSGPDTSNVEVEINEEKE